MSSWQTKKLETAKCAIFVTRVGCLLSQHPQVYPHVTSQCDQVPPRIDQPWSSNKSPPACACVWGWRCTEGQREDLRRRGPLRCALLSANLAYKRKMSSSPMQPAAHCGTWGIQQVPIDISELSVLQRGRAVRRRTDCLHSLCVIDGINWSWTGVLATGILHLGDILISLTESEGKLAVYFVVSIRYKNTVLYIVCVCGNQASL